MKKLAIVIPAYKVDFFETVLFSLAQQTCKDFTVYIGEDCSRDDFKSLIEQYSKQLDIVYRRFEVNFGGHDLVAQWNRCVIHSFAIISQYKLKGFGIHNEHRSLYYISV